MTLRTGPKVLTLPGLTLPPLLALLIVASACGARTGPNVPAPSPDGTCPVGPSFLPTAPLSGLAPVCLGTPVGLTGGMVTGIVRGGVVGTTTDVTFSSLRIVLFWTDGGVPCGSATFPTTNTISIVISGLRYRAQNNLFTPCVRRSRIDFARISVTTASPPSLPLSIWLFALGIIGPTPVLLPELDAAALPFATAGAASCPLTLGSLPSGRGTRCSTWSELPANMALAGSIPGRSPCGQWFSRGADLYPFGGFSVSVGPEAMNLSARGAATLFGSVQGPGQDDPLARLRGAPRLLHAWDAERAAAFTFGETRWFFSSVAKVT